MVLHIGEFGLTGLIIDFLWLITDLAVGSAIDDKIVNYLNVNIVESIKSVSNKIILYNSETDKNGIRYNLIEGETETNRIHDFYPFYVFSRLWSEQQFIQMYNSNTYARSNIVSLDAIFRNYLPKVYE